MRIEPLTQSNGVVERKSSIRKLPCNKRLFLSGWFYTSFQNQSLYYTFLQIYCIFPWVLNLYFSNVKIVSVFDWNKDSFPLIFLSTQPYTITWKTKSEKWKSVFEMAGMILIKSDTLEEAVVRNFFVKIVCCCCVCVCVCVCVFFLFCFVFVFFVFSG